MLIMRSVREFYFCLAVRVESGNGKCLTDTVFNRLLILLWKPAEKVLGDTLDSYDISFLEWSTGVIH
jgi:hypothetical protein